MKTKIQILISIFLQLVLQQAFAQSSFNYDYNFNKQYSIINQEKDSSKNTYGTYSSVGRVENISSINELTLKNFGTNSSLKITLDSLRKRLMYYQKSNEKKYHRYMKKDKVKVSDGDKSKFKNKKDFIKVMELKKDANFKGGCILLKDNQRNTLPVTTQGIVSSIKTLDNTIATDAILPFLDFGAKLSGLRINYLTRYKFYLSEDNYLVEDIRKHYFYFDFITRGIKAIDSLNKTITEYINSKNGSPLTFRYKYQRELSKKYSSYITGFSEPRCFFNLSLDGRFTPLYKLNDVKNMGSSFHIMPSLIWLFPAGSNESKIDEDNIFIEFTTNFYFTSTSIYQNIADQRFSYNKKNSGIDIELLIGINKKSSAGNANLIIRYENFGFNKDFDKFSIGVAFAPQITGDAKKS